MCEPNYIIMSVCLYVCPYNYVYIYVYSIAS